MRNALALCGGKLRGPDIHAAVKLHGIDIDHFPTQFMGKGQPERGFAGRGGANYCDGAHVTSQPAT